MVARPRRPAAQAWPPAKLAVENPSPHAWASAPVVCYRSSVVSARRPQTRRQARGYMATTTVCAAGGARRPQQQRRQSPGGGQPNQQRSKRGSGAPPPPPPPPGQRGSTTQGRAPRQRQQRGASDAPSYQQRKNPELYAMAAQPSPAAAVSAAQPGSSGGSEGSSSSSAAARPAVVTLPRHKPEVLAPVGGWPQLEAAVQNGADAVYFGLTDFNARARASNFTPEEVSAAGWAWLAGGCRHMLQWPCSVQAQLSTAVQCWPLLPFPCRCWITALPQLPEVMSYLHDRGVKGYVVVNVLGEEAFRCLATHPSLQLPCTALWLPAERRLLQACHQC